MWLPSNWSLALVSDCSPSRSLRSAPTFADNSAEGVACVAAMPLITIVLTPSADCNSRLSAFWPSIFQ